MQSTLGNRIQLAMKKRKVKPKEIIEFSGITKGAFSSYINDRYQPKNEVIIKIAKYLNVSEDWLKGKNVPMETLENKLQEISFDDIEKQVVNNKLSFLKSLTTLDILFLVCVTIEELDLSKKYFEKKLLIYNSFSKEEISKASMIPTKIELSKYYLKRYCTKENFIDELVKRDIFKKIDKNIQSRKVIVNKFLDDLDDLIINNSISCNAVSKLDIECLKDKYL